MTTTIEMPRVLTPDQATDVVGQRVAVLEPTVIAPDTIVRDADTGVPLLGYFPLENPAPLRRALLTIDCSGGVQRSKNYRSRSTTFGYSPRRPVLWRESCSITALNLDHPEVAALLESYSDQFAPMLDVIDPDIAPADREVVAEVLDDWRMGTAKLWTSGVVNDTAALPYHRDGFNFSTWSAMPVLRRGTRGGYLHIPEYNVVLPCDDSTVTMFKGQQYVHGVTPITRLKKGEGYRISVVYYALRGMKNCREAAEEAAYGRVRRTEREADMAKRLEVGDRGIPGANGKKTTALNRMHGSLTAGGFDPDNTPIR